MDCDRLKETLTAAFDGETQGAEAEAARQHVAQCPHCQTLWHEWHRQRQALRALPEMSPPPHLLGAVYAACGLDQAAGKANTAAAAQPCVVFEPLLTAAFDGELQAVQLELVHRHLQQCSPCQAMWQHWHTQRAALQAMPVPPVPAGLAQRVLAACQAPREPQPALWGTYSDARHQAPAPSLPAPGAMNVVTRFCSSRWAAVAAVPAVLLWASLLDLPGMVSLAVPSPPDTLPLAPKPNLTKIAQAGADARTDAKPAPTPAVAPAAEKVVRVARMEKQGVKRSVRTIDSIEESHSRITRVRYHLPQHLRDEGDSDESMVPQPERARDNDSAGRRVAMKSSVQPPRPAPQPATSRTSTSNGDAVDEVRRLADARPEALRHVVDDFRASIIDEEQSDDGSS